MLSRLRFCLLLPLPLFVFCRPWFLLLRSLPSIISVATTPIFVLRPSYVLYPECSNPGDVLLLLQNEHFGSSDNFKGRFYQ